MQRPAARAATWKTVAVLLLASAATALAASRFSLLTLVNFDLTNGGFPAAPLVQGTDGNFYGTTLGGGASGQGTVFRMRSTGALATLYSFCSWQDCADGAVSSAGLVLGPDGDFYGTTQQGGFHGAGAVFKLTPQGSLAVLHSFSGADGATPVAALVAGTGDNFYGTTFLGGHSGAGTVFTLSPTGKLATLHSFCSEAGCPDGANPFAALIQAGDGNFYGTTEAGGQSGAGTIFRIARDGTLTTLYSFCSEDFCLDGSSSDASLVEGHDGALYGTTFYGGALGVGTVFRLTAAGRFTTLHDFCSEHPACADGAFPNSGVILGTDGNLYGTTDAGGAGDACQGGCGTLFRINAAGAFQTLHTFNSGDGAMLFAGLVQATSGLMYGTTTGGGSRSVGTIFSLTTQLSPFVKTVPVSGPAGTSVRILGTDLRRPTAVAFNGVAADFTVISPTLIRTTVPAGAATGSVQVTTPSGTLSSNVAFRVKR